ncbi:hypothetical protein ZWY2020_031668 [Hordeum vulgare]|nr:hypothetical protein ZWY2020_031668 [Hordeum vulgare]
MASQPPKRSQRVVLVASYRTYAGNALLSLLHHLVSTKVPVLMSHGCCRRRAPSPCSVQDEISGSIPEPDAELGINDVFQIGTLQRVEAYSLAPPTTQALLLVVEMSTIAKLSLEGMELRRTELPLTQETSEVQGSHMILLTTLVYEPEWVERMW